MKTLPPRAVLLLLTLTFWAIIPARTPTLAAFLPLSVMTERGQGGEVNLSAGSEVNPATPTPQPVTADQVNAVSRNLYCPVCQNTPLEVCPTDACARWRDQVRDLLAQGESEDQVRQYFIDHFGMRTVGAPTDTGGQLFTIALPLLMIGIIGALISWNILRRRALTLISAAAVDPPITDLPEDYRARLEQELEDRS